MKLSEFGILVMLGISGIYDLRNKKVSVRSLFGFMIGGVGLLILGRGISWEQAILGMGMGLLLCCLSVITRGSIGMGDGMVLAVCGIYLGYRATFFIFLVANLFCALVAGALLLSKKIGKTSRLPFIPFLWMAGLIFVLGEMRGLWK